MNRKLLIAANWKMHKTCTETNSFLECFLQKCDASNCDILICPPFTSILTAAKYKKNNLKIGAQNVNENASGAYTGEISAKMLADIGAEYVIVGHSERRLIYGETDQVINKKIIAAINSNIIPILCIGETLQQRESNLTKNALESQLSNCLLNVNEHNMTTLTIAYEPVWAIGTGKTATPELAQNTHKLIRDWISSNISKSAANNVRILYGGSLKPDNANQILNQPDIDGGLIGGASLDPDSLLAIIQNI